jgi:hypothetical protein
MITGDCATKIGTYTGLAYYECSILLFEVKKKRQMLFEKVICRLSIEEEFSPRDLMGKYQGSCKQRQAC